MDRMLPRRRHKGVALLSCILMLGLCPAADSETICDSPGAVTFEPSVDPTLLNGIIDLLEELDLSFTLEDTIDIPLQILYSHTIESGIDSVIPIEGAEFIVDASQGSLEVSLLYDTPWEDVATMTATHDERCYIDCNGSIEQCSDACYAESLACDQNCYAQSAICDDNCYAESYICDQNCWTSCVNQCDANWWLLPCFGDYNCCVSVGAYPCYGVCLAGCGTVWTACEAACGTAWAACETGCGTAWTACEALCGADWTICAGIVGTCLAEAEVVNLLLAAKGNQINVSFDSLTITQTADICVAEEDCSVQFPLVSTNVEFENFVAEYFPEDDPLDIFGIGAWLNTVVVSVIMPTIEQKIIDTVTLADGNGLLMVPLIPSILTGEGGLPPQEVLDCRGGGCTPSAQASTHQAGTLHGSTELTKHLAYLLLPFGMLIGLGIWRRKR